MEKPCGGEDLVADAQYHKPSLVCDIVMKGGITSGVTYPWAVCEIARTYRLRNIGGTSAGAIAAAVAAAAETGRSVKGAGFGRLASLPLRLPGNSPGSRDSVLFNLFQPNPPTARYFGILSASLRSKKSRWGIFGILGAAVRGAPVAAAAGASLGVATLALLIDLAAGNRGLGANAAAVSGVALGILLGALVTLVGGVGGVAFRLASRGLRDISENSFGLCRGYVEAKDKKEPVSNGDDMEIRDGRSRPKPLTTWLADELDALAWEGGKRLAGPEDRRQGAPLTLGDLADAGVNLKMFTTNLTEGSPYTLPVMNRTFYFDPKEFRKYFPKRVVAWMDKIAPKPEDARDQDERNDFALAAAHGLKPLPDPGDMPVVVITRFSLSFPVLLSAVPLWRIYDEPTPRVPKECWFSDGGITSNFPVHFFDSPLPRWPTFGINLGPAGPHELSANDESKNIQAPLKNGQGVVPRWSEIKGLIGFGHAIADTMQNWMDNAQTRVPGYNDRIVLVKHSTAEGGLNLNMERDLICRFATRGRKAGEFLVKRFSGESSTNDGDELSWTNHRWVRFRSVLPLIETMHSNLVRGYEWPPRPANLTYDQMIAGQHDYAAWCNDDQRDRVRHVMPKLIHLAKDWTHPPAPDPNNLPPPDLRVTPRPGTEPYDADSPFACGAPRPRPTIRIVRDF
jgi:hypothetical protein